MQLVDDRYELIEVIASGGMATVWRARDRVLDRLVAVKRPHPGPAGDSSAERLIREARAAAQLSHPNLITVYDFGSDESGPYLVMELVSGPTLQEIAGKVSPNQAVDIGAQLADGLVAVHAAGIVHRDVKPSNVVMSNRGPLLTDFGIARDPKSTAEVTEPGCVIATPSYAAPEVLSGTAPTTASDVYSLAVTVDKLFRSAGVRPNVEWGEVLAAAQSSDPEVRPSAALFADVLRRGAPAATGGAALETTRILPSPPTIPNAEGSDGSERRRVWLWAAGLLGLVAIALAVIGLVVLSGDDPPADAAPPSSMSFTPSTTTSTTSSTSTTLKPTTTLEDPEASLAAERERLETVLLEPPRSDLNPNEVADVMKKVDEAIEASGEGDLDKAGKNLSEVAKRIDEKLEASRFREAMASLTRLGEALGVDIDLSEEDKDDD